MLLNHTLLRIKDFTKGTTTIEVWGGVLALGKLRQAGWIDGKLNSRVDVCGWFELILPEFEDYNTIVVSPESVGALKAEGWVDYPISVASAEPEPEKMEFVCEVGWMKSELARQMRAIGR
jgi:hypothetical protein